MGSNLNKWNKEKMQAYCDINAIGYTVLDEKFIDKGYQNQQHALVKCDKKEHESYWVWWNHFTHNRRCAECNRIQLSNKFRSNINDVKRVFNEYGFELLDENDFTNVDSSIGCVDYEGFKYYTCVTSLRKHGKITSKFDSNNPYSIDNIKLFCKLYRNDYEIVSNKYTKIKDKYIWKYNGEFYDELEHCRYFICTADSFIHGVVKHPDLSISKFELEMRKVLDFYNIDYETEKTFDGCVYKNKLRFDFYLKAYNVCIETDGMQHIIPVELWGGEKALKETIKRDNIKNKFCGTNNIPLIRIHYSNINDIDSVLLKELKKLHIKINEGNYQQPRKFGCFLGKNIKRKEVK